MTFAGIYDSVGRLPNPPLECPLCHGTARVNGGACLGCLLQAGVEEVPPNETCQLGELLAEIDIRDSDWRLGHYQILEEIGRGGMGVIYRARQQHSKRIVALKRVLSYHGDSRETLERFRREAEAAASLDHPNILPIYEVGQADGLPFFTMKYATGGTLQQAAPALRGHPRECVRLLAKVTRAVAYAHREGILHRDLKPGNILLDSRGEPMVSDFGLAKWIDATSDLTRSLAVFGTPGFIAPEQVHGNRDQLTPAADTYSLGAILFDLLGGRPPFLGEHALAVIKQATDRPAPNLRTLNRSLGKDLETICAKCLEREPQLRYRAASDLADDLERYLEGRPIIARPTIVPVKIWRWCKRNPIPATAGAVCLIAAAIAGIGEVNNWRLQRQVTAQAAAQHSIEINPFLDLDAAQPAIAVSQDFARRLDKSLTAFGPHIVRLRTRLTGQNQSNSPSAAQTPPRSRLYGTTRVVAGKVRLVMELQDAVSGAVLLHEISEADSSTVLPSATRMLARQAYPLLSASDLKEVAIPSTDPGLLDTESRNFIKSGLELITRRSGLDLDRSIACLEHALQLQPDSCATHSALAKAFSYKAFIQSAKGALQTALIHAQRAVELNPNNADAHLALGGVFYQSRKMAEAIEENLLAIEAAPGGRRPGGLLSNVYKAIGRPDKALPWIVIARGNEGSPGETLPGIGDCLTDLLRDEEAQKLFEHYAQLHPEQPEGWLGLCRLELLNGRIQRARAIYQRERKDYPDFSYAQQMAAEVEFFARNPGEAEALYNTLWEKNPEGGGNFYGCISYQSALGYLRLARGDQSGAALLHLAKENEIAKLQDAPKTPDVLYRLAAIESSLGEKESAIRHLSEAAEAGAIDFRSLELDPRFDSIRTDEHFVAVAKSMKEHVATLWNEKLRSVVQLTNN